MEGFYIRYIFAGTVCTALQGNWPGMFGVILRFAAKCLFLSPLSGALTLTYCILLTELQKGQMYTDCGPINMDKEKVNSKDALTLWDVSEKMCRSYLN